MTVKEVIIKTKCNLKSQGYHKHRIWDVNRTFKKFLDFVKVADSIEFTQDLANDFYKSTFAEMEEKNPHSEEVWSAQRAVQMLKEVNSTGAVIKKNYGSLNELDPYYSSILAEYTEDCFKTQHLAPKTVEARITVLKDFMLALEHQGILDASRISIDEIERFLLGLTNRQAPASIYANMGRLKRFIKYLVEKSILSPIILYKWPRVKPPAKNMTMVEIFTPEELKVLIDSIDRANPCGKRLYAMVLLSLTTGMRGGEVCNVEFEDFNWRESSLMLTHEKSGKKSIIKIQPAAGNAIVQYIANGRPESGIPFVFLQKTKPGSTIEKMENSNYSRQLLRQIELCGLKVDKLQHTGSHALRHAFASMLLRENTELPVISEILGHSNTTTTSGYTKVDIEHLRDCALDVTHLLEGQEDGYDW